MRKGQGDGREILLVGEVPKSNRIQGERIEEDEQEGRESSKKRKSQAERGKSDVYLSQQTKTREDTQGVI